MYFAHLMSVEMSSRPVRVLLTCLCSVLLLASPKDTHSSSFRKRVANTRKPRCCLREKTRYARTLLLSRSLPFAGYLPTACCWTDQKSEREPEAGLPELAAKRGSRLSIISHRQHFAGGARHGVQMLVPFATLIPLQMFGNCVQTKNMGKPILNTKFTYILTQVLYHNVKLLLVSVLLYS